MGEELFTRLEPIFVDEPPPKYEDIATQSWKPEDEGLTEYRLQHRSGTQGQIFTISLSARTSDSQPGLGMERPEGLAIEAEPEAWGRPERGTAPEGGATPERGAFYFSLRSNSLRRVSLQ